MNTLKLDANFKHNILKDFMSYDPPEWLIKHSLRTAACAYCIKIGEEYSPAEAYIAGLYHDIGRIHSPEGSRHAIEGYLLVQGKYPGIARVCLTHSFPTGNAYNYQGLHNCNEHEIKAIQECLNDRKDIDGIIMLADCYSETDDFVTPFVRFKNIDKRLRDSNNEQTEKIRNAYLKLHRSYGINVSDLNTYNQLADCYEQDMQIINMIRRKI